MNNSTPEKILERLMLATNARSEAALAAAIGISHQAVYNARNKGSVPPAWVFEVAKRFAVSTDWLFFGTGEMQPEVYSPIHPAPIVPAQSVNTLAVINCHDCEITLVPMVEAVLSAGGGSFETGGVTDRRYAFRSDFLQRKGQASQMVLMRVAGDSMEPEIKDSDVVLIDQSNKRLLPNGIYAVAVEDMVYLKRVNALPGKIILTSYNELYAPIEVETNGDLEDSVRIIGRVVWWCREA
ncbi:LexA family transcriptional regulator [Desulfovibrio cuneatus]|uniref:LexA family transcriptional regulator n=1 Tax=Desulfovibrio cuneatus TaxID=159728 RepID=UPI000415D2EE|nr:S24 family peptidase [Desulfovibrio cuneatus]